MDTSCLVAAVVAAHPQHSACLGWLSHAKQGAIEVVISAHSIAELFAVLTRLPAKPKITGPAALQLIAGILACVKPVVLSPQGYEDLINALAQAGLVGGVVYDGIIAKVAELESVDHLLTLNMADFQRLWPSAARLVVSPQSMAPP
jgi:predicted nucleic acid-binding protein